MLYLQEISLSLLQLFSILIVSSVTTQNGLTSYPHSEPAVVCHGHMVSLLALSCLISQAGSVPISAETPGNFWDWVSPSSPAWLKTLQAWSLSAHIHSFLLEPMSHLGLGPASHSSWTAYLFSMDSHLQNTPDGGAPLSSSPWWGEIVRDKSSKGYFANMSAPALLGGAAIPIWFSGPSLIRQEKKIELCDTSFIHFFQQIFIKCLPCPGLCARF